MDQPATHALALKDAEINLLDTAGTQEANWTLDHCSATSALLEQAEVARDGGAGGLQPDADG